MYLSLSTADLPLDILDAHFLASLVVVVVPFALGKINSSKRCVRLDASGLEITLEDHISYRSRNLIARYREHTSALKSTNSRPRQSRVRMFCAFEGSC
jgi:hypothetical protein